MGEPRYRNSMLSADRYEIDRCMTCLFFHFPAVSPRFLSFRGLERTCPRNRTGKRGKRNRPQRETKTKDLAMGRERKKRLMQQSGKFQLEVKVRERTLRYRLKMFQARERRPRICAICIIRSTRSHRPLSADTDCPSPAWNYPCDGISLTGRDYDRNNNNGNK